MATDLELQARRFRNSIPDAHRKSIDTRIQWLWNQRFGTVQQVWQSSKDMLDHTAATLVLQAGKRTLSLKADDLEHYKGERGRRGNKLPRGFQRVDGLQVELPA